MPLVMAIIESNINITAGKSRQPRYPLQVAVSVKCCLMFHTINQGISFNFADNSEVESPSQPAVYAEVGLPANGRETARFAGNSEGLWKDRLEAVCVCK